jgi:hypothetical protein
MSTELRGLDRWIEGNPDSYFENDEPIPDGWMCSGDCSHFIKDRDDEYVYFHNGLPYCEDCFRELEILPSETFWDIDNRENWLVDDLDSYYGEDERE